MGSLPRAPCCILHSLVDKNGVMQDLFDNELISMHQHYNQLRFNVPFPMQLCSILTAAISKPKTHHCIGRLISLGGVIPRCRCSNMEPNLDFISEGSVTMSTNL